MEVIIIILICVVFLGIIFSSGDEGSAKPSIRPSAVNSTIQDKDVDALAVLLHLEGFKPSVKADKKNGFSEKDVHDDLEIYLKKLYHSVTREHAIDGKNVKRIDFDLGNGRVGIEVKLAESVLSESENDRLIGQAQKYAGRKYGANLIIALAGYSHHTRNTIIHELKMDVERSGAHFIFLKARTPRK